MKKENGITLISLVMTIILIMILAAVGTYTGVQVFENMRVRAFVARMKTVQEAVDKFCENHSVQEINAMKSNPETGSEFQLTNEARQVFSKVTSAEGETRGSWHDAAGDDIIDNYIYFSVENIEKYFGLKDFNTPIFFNPRSRNVISTSNVEYNGIKYYRQYDLPGGQSLPERDFSTNFQLENVNVKTYDNKAVISVESDVKISELKYKKNGGNYITVNNIKQDDGENKFVGEIEVTESGIYTVETKDSRDGTVKTADNINVTIVNHPVLVGGLEPVKYESGNFVSADKEEWYNYGEGRWALAMLSEGTDATKNSVYVWIPRYAYYIDDSNNINIEFMKENSSFITTANEALEKDYNVIPAFKDGTNNGFANGEWDSELTGIWVAKYEATLDETNSYAKSVSNGSATVGGTINEYYNYCQSIKTNVEQIDKSNVNTHLMKNSEWGAVAYLSEYSKNKENSEYRINNLVGGIQEMVAAGIDITTLNSSNISNKYVTLYNSDISKNEIYGDGLDKIDIDNDKYPNSENKLFVRGGYGDDSTNNYFTYSRISTPDNHTGFRPVLIIEY